MNLQPDRLTQNLPGPIAEQLDRMLDEDERIVWVHRDRPGRSLRDGLWRWLLAVGLIGAATAMLLVVRMLVGELTSTFLLASGGVSILLAILVAMAIMVHGGLRHYVLTDRRMIELAVNGLGTVTFRVHSLARPGRIRARRKRDGWTVTLAPFHHALEPGQRYYQIMTFRNIAMRLEGVDDLKPLRTRLGDLLVAEADDGD